MTRGRMVVRPALECLDGRCLLSAGFAAVTPLAAPAHRGGGTYYRMLVDGAYRTFYIPERVPGVPNGSGAIGTTANPAPDPFGGGGIIPGQFSQPSGDRSSGGLIGGGYIPPVPPGDTDPPTTLFAADGTAASGAGSSGGTPGLALNTPADRFVDRTFTALMGRAPSPAELSSWIGVDRRFDNHYVRHAIARSTEAKSYHAGR